MPQSKQNRLQLYMSAGLTDKEAVIYDILLETGEKKAAELEKLSGLKKNTYTLLKNLTKRKLVLPIKKDGLLFYQVLPPDRLLELIKEQEQTVAHTKKHLTNMLPSLKSQYNMVVHKPTVRYYEGADGLREVFADIYAPKDKPVYGAIDVDKIEGFMQGMSEGELIPTRKKHELAVKVIFNDTPFARKLHAMDAEQNRESLLFDLEKYPLPAEIEAYEDKVALMSFKENEFVGLIIQNEDFAITLGSILRYLFDHLRTCQHHK